jgi:MFS family permease
MSKPRIFTRSIILLGLVSLFTDISSEMLYPVMPVYLQSIGYTALWIGLLEGIAEATAGLSKAYFGKMSDDQGRRMPFVSLGYGLSSLAKPLIILFVHPLWVLFCRMSDRLGKGIRTGARDAVLAGESLPENRGRIFGFHRAMDTTGAVIGPVLALIWLKYHPASYRILFLAALLPALIGVLCTLLVKETVSVPATKPKRKNVFSFFSYWKAASPEFKKLSRGLILFALFNSSDIFLLLIAKQQGLSDTRMILAYVFYNLVYALASYPFGILADKVGMKFMLCMGFVFFAIAYGGMPFAHSTTMLFGLFFIYGLYAAAADGVSKAWASRLVPATETGTAIGFLAGCTSLAAIAASFITGWTWVQAGPMLALELTAGAAVLTLVYFVFGVRKSV